MLTILTGRTSHDRATMGNLDDLFAALARSKFRSRFRLGEKEVACLNQKGTDIILQHARDFVTNRLATAQPHNDGRQTPMRGPGLHRPARYGTCCRSCLAKWHGIEKGKPLDPAEVDYVVGVIGQWLGLHGAAR